MFSNIKAVIFDLDGTLYDFKDLPKRLIWAMPTHALRLGADRKIRKSLKNY